MRHVTYIGRGEIYIIYILPLRVSGTITLNLILKAARFECTDSM